MTISDEKKLHIDEDWKSQVDREKSAWRKKQADASSGSNSFNESAASEQSPSSDEGLGDAVRAGESDDSRTSGELPPASLAMLITSLASQAMASLGQLPDESGRPMPKNLPLARHFIDLLGVLEDKTQNNLTSEEAAFLNSTLHHLRMAFVEVSRQ